METVENFKWIAGFIIAWNSYLTIHMIMLMRGLDRNNERDKGVKEFHLKIDDKLGHIEVMIQNIVIALAKQGIDVESRK